MLSSTMPIYQKMYVSFGYWPIGRMKCNHKNEAELVDDNKGNNNVSYNTHTHGSVV